MKKFYALLMTCLLLVFLSVPQIVDAGVGHSRSGGSSRSSSRNSSRSSGGGSRSGGSSYHYYRSGYGSSSDSSASSPYLGFMFILVGGIILVVIVKSLQNKSGDSSSTYTSNDYQTLHRRVEHNTLAISRVTYGDPNFDAEAFTSWVKEVYLKLQVAWTEKNWNSVRALESTSLYSQHSTQLEDHIRAKTTNVLEKVCIENVRIKEFIENPDGNDTLVVILSSTLRDYVIDDETRRVLEGDPKKDLFTVYQLNFIRQHGSQTQAVTPDEVVSDHCPNCGAPLKISAVSECDYCGANLSRSPNQWVLDTYDVVDEDELYN
ncbi:zinc-ribbon domain-containing transport protein [Streptococcus sp. SO2]|uniref:zinc-ribbon domain-containing transport protein n=1 Tax=Streptococcus TaxID=1301 RepID=UPI00066A1D1C|nr:MULTISPECIES: zinc-ribbon domain-containing transport protein [Streptococcus]MDN5014275.1 zinc-ribbon domain-containing transport protein [Streptococcus sp. SO2]